MPKIGALLVGLGPKTLARWSVLTGLQTCHSHSPWPCSMRFCATLYRSMDCLFPCAGSTPPACLRARAFARTFRVRLPSAPGTDLRARSPAHTSMGSPAHTRHSGCACDVARFRPQCAFSYDQHTTPCTVSAKVQTHSAKTAHFQHSSPNGSALWQLHRLRSWPHHHQTGELHH